MGNDFVIGATVKSTLTSIQRSREALERTSERLATGKKVNRATDQPQNFFKASALNHTASNYTRLLDRIGTGIRTVQQAFTGLEAIENILNLAEVKALDAKKELEQTSSALPNAILADAPVGYFRLNDADGPLATNLGSLGAGHIATYENGVTQGDEILFYGAGGLPAKFNGVNQYVAVDVDDSINTLGPYDEKTIELIFNADTTAGRQVLWEEGGPVNNLNIYIDNGVLRVNGRTTSGGGWGPLDISVPIDPDVTYHVALVQDANNNRFSGYLNGELFGSAFIPGPIGSHPNRNAIGAIDEYIYFHDDGPGNAPNNQMVRPDGSFAFQGQMSDLAFYNTIISQEDLRARYEATSLPISEAYKQDMQTFLQQITDIIEDTQFRGINLLDKENVTVQFNDLNTSKIKVKGTDLSIEALGLADLNFQKPSQVEASINAVRKAISKVRDYATTLQNSLNIIQIRQDFTRNFIVNKQAGAGDLINADLNEEGANLLSSQTRLDLSTTALSLAAQSQASILEIFAGRSSIFGG
ncbi:MAG TPA: hypothetical protein PLF01_03500 [Alphaproteobacteria bacterium]|nr:hypothetical protein [Alphaproteobacteria bacterium]